MTEMLWRSFVTIITNPYIIILLALCVLVKILYPKFRGFMGEFWVKEELKSLPSEEYIVINDVMIEQNDNTHQIDHIIISRFGIFVIEMKNYYGHIWGDEYKSKWIQRVGKSKRYFQNPIHQNYGHIKALEALLGLSEDCFIPIVCFSNQAKLKIKVSDNSVVQLDNLISLVKEYKDTIIEDSINNIRDKILESNITDRLKRKNHVKNIKNNLKKDEIKIQNMICPKCGGKLIKRKGKYGEFIGCSNYPKCRFTKQ